MSIEESGFEHHVLPATHVATLRFELQERRELPARLQQIRQLIPEQQIRGPAFCLLYFVSSAREGQEVQAGFPVDPHFQSGELECWTTPEMQVLSLLHKGPLEELGQSYRRLFGYTAERGIISDEFCREVYRDPVSPLEGPIEVQFVVHDWAGLLEQHLERVLGPTARQEVLAEQERPTIESSLEQRFEWLGGVLERLAKRASAEQVYDIISNCAHVFPAEPLIRARAVYEQARAQGHAFLQAVDAVLEFMAGDAAWGRVPTRRGEILYTSKAPSNPQAHEQATTAAERRRAYCFCPMIRTYLEEGVPQIFCHCGAGWYRRQWETILGRAVRIEIIKSLTRGDEECSLAIHLPREVE